MKNRINDRAIALRILLQLFVDKTSLAHAFQTHSHTVSALTKAICFGVCRHYYRLQVVADALIASRPKSRTVWLTLLIGLYQLLYLDKPVYATINETVGLLNEFHCSWAKGFINATMHALINRKPAVIANMQANAAFNYGHPEWLLKILQHDWPLQWQAILEANDNHPPMSLRVNLGKTSRRDYLNKLREAGMAAQPHIRSLSGITLSNSCNVDSLPGFSAGEVSVQDEAAQFAVELLQLTAGVRVLDACAAPGGKTAHILESESNLKECVALDIDKRRLQQIKDNLMRLHLKATIIHGDGSKPDHWWNQELFDRILLDAPCSATGVIRRHPDIKLLRTQMDIDRVVIMQRDLLNSLWLLLNEGGIMVYATCSILHCENEQQVSKFINTHPDCELMPFTNFCGIFTGHGWQILPGTDNRDGFFYSVFKKKNKEV
ncbi:MAG: 16S rRNA (cytosine(967)-C(5))-methyltransferase [Legionellales bacterium RIFCSPHIGHO2_12_FULL_35_11]|nr:MAG: 16S rRNA (cytosine(967)-C(5))-methyltransferase [Legionellales bacterium RIFCSPHIGHO2_12_FULL_35_11]